MKRFCLKVLLLIIISGALLCLMNALYIRTNYWKSENHMNKFENISYDLSLGNVGSSHTCYGIKYNAVPEMSAWNLALSNQPYFYDYAVLKQYIDHFKENAVIVICISYFEITRRPDYSVYRSRYYRILPRESMDFWSLKEYIVFKLLPILSAGICKIYILHDIPQEAVSPYYNRNIFLEGKKLEEYCIVKHKSWTSPELEKGEEGYRQNSAEVAAMIDLCYEHKLCPVLITTPITDILNNIYAQDEGFFTTFERFTTGLCTKYPGLLYLDYSRDEEFSVHHEYFADGDHLNNIGAEKFTKRLVADLKKLDLL